MWAADGGTPLRCTDACFSQQEQGSSSFRFICLSFLVVCRTLGAISLSLASFFTRSHGLHTQETLSSLPLHAYRYAAVCVGLLLC